MKPIGEANITQFPQSERRSSRDEIRMQDGMPADRTICPWCLQQEQGCRKCGGTGVVCPTCRGARVLRSETSQRPLVIGCHDCTDWGNHSQHRWDDSGWPQFARDVRREAEAIRRERGKA